jgi:hypothetical protein
MLVPMRVGIAFVLIFRLLLWESGRTFQVHSLAHHGTTIKATTPSAQRLLQRRRLHAAKQPTDESADISVAECFEEATSSMRSCARFALASFVVDVVLDSREFLEESWPDRVAQGIAMMWKVTLALDLFRFTMANNENNRGRLNTKETVNLPDLVDTSYRYMSRMWRRTACVLLIETAAEIAGELKGRHPWLPRAFVSVAVATSVGLRFLSEREFQAVSKRSVPRGKIDPSSLQKAHATFQSMTMCTASLIARAFVMPAMALASDRKPVHLIKRAVMFRTRATIALLLWTLRRATLQGFDAAIRGQATPEARSRLYKSQSRFFEKAADIFKEEAVLKLVLTFAALVLAFLRTSGFLSTH